jgi:hypothetical protein
MMINVSIDLSFDQDVAVEQLMGFKFFWWLPNPPKCVGYSWKAAHTGCICHNLLTVMVLYRWCRWRIQSVLKLAACR